MTFLIWEHRLHNRLLPPILNFRNVFIYFTQLLGKLTETVRWTVFRRAGYGSTLVQIDRHGDSLPARRGQHPRERPQAILLIPFSYNASHTKNMPFSTSNIDIIHNNW